MKPVSRAAAAVLAALTAATGCHRHGARTAPRSPQVVSGSGIIAREVRPLSPIREVCFATRGDLRITPGARESLALIGEDNLLPYIVTATSNEMLTIRTASGVDLVETWPIEFELTVVDLRRLEWLGVGDAELASVARDELVLRSSGIGTLRCPDLDVGDLDLSLSGLGKAELAGRVDSQVVRVSELGHSDGARLASRRAVVTVEGRSEASVSVSERLVVRVGDGCTVYYRGDPVVESTIFGSGRLVKIP